MTTSDLYLNRMYGLILGLVSNNHDPDNLGRIKVKYHMLDQSIESDWCRVVSFFAGPDRGNFWMPEINDEVVIAFEHGDVNFPFVLGSVFNGKTKPPAESDKDNNVKRLRSRSGHELTFDDTSDKERITILDSSGTHRIEIDVSKKKITIQADDGDLDLLAPKGKLRIECKELEIDASKSASLRSGGPLSLESEKDFSLRSQAQVKCSAQKRIQIESTSNAVQIKASKALNASADAVDLYGRNVSNLRAGTRVKVKAQRIDLNP